MNGKRAAAIIGAYTGVACGPFSDIHEYVDEYFPGITTIGFAMPEMVKQIQEKTKPDFLEVCEWLQTH